VVSRKYPYLYGNTPPPPERPPLPAPIPAEEPILRLLGAWGFTHAMLAFAEATEVAQENTSGSLTAA